VGARLDAEEFRESCLLCRPIMTRPVFRPGGHRAHAFPSGTELIETTQLAKGPDDFGSGVGARAKDHVDAEGLLKCASRSRVRVLDVAHRFKSGGYIIDPGSTVRLECGGRRNNIEPAGPMGLGACLLQLHRHRAMAEIWR